MTMTEHKVSYSFNEILVEVVIVLFYTEAETVSGLQSFCFLTQSQEKNLKFHCYQTFRICLP